jgi:membrane protein required for colicin V production
MTGWNGLDWILIGILLFSTIQAWMRGLVSALFGLLGLVVGFELASWEFAAAGDWMVARDWLHSVAAARLIAFLAIAIGIAALFEVVGRGAKKSAHAVGLGLVDRMLGALFGIARGLLVGVAVIVGASAIAPLSRWSEGSQLSSYFLDAARAVSFHLPHDLR